MRKFTYKKLTDQDLHQLKELINVYIEVFEVKNFSIPSAGYLKTLLEKEHIIFFTALAGNAVVGGLTAYTLPSVYIEKSEIYIYDLAVKAEYQRKGIGRQIINELKQYCKQLGKEIFVQADIEDQHAIDFYSATGGRPESVIHFSYDLEV